MVLFHAGAQQLDSGVVKALDLRLLEYVSAMERESVETKNAECDFLISSSGDSLVTQHVALKLYGYYIESPLMGDEAVAIHIYDTWFAPRKVAMCSEIDLMNAGVFADFNRSSLIGSKAPELALKTRLGDTDTLFFDTNKRFSVLFFYDTSCSRCKIESVLLRNLLSTSDYPVDFYAVYTGDDSVQWDAFIEERLAARYGNTRIFHLWDPELDSDMQRKYSLLQTPRIFLIAPDGTIIGRGLDSEALLKMLSPLFEEPELVYGSESSLEFYDRLFMINSGEAPSYSDLTSVADHIASASLERGDTVMYRQMTGDLLYYLAPKTDGTFKEASAYVARSKILSRPDIWKSSDDSLKVIGFAMMIDDLLSRSEPGSLIADLTLPGELLTSKKSRSGEWKLRRLKKDHNFIIFYTEGCHICDAEKSAAREILSARKKAKGIGVLLVNVDKIAVSDKASQLFDSFDLSTLPLIIETDRGGRVLRRYVSLLQ